MSQRTWPQTQAPPTLARKPRMLNFRFFPAGAGNPTTTAQDVKGVASIVRNGTAGEWLITLQDTYKRLLSAQATIQMATATDLVPQFSTISNVGTTSAVTLLLRANAVATPTDIAANANNSISVTLIFDDGDS
jgi:hypothetical protein